ncbi:glycosyltransferase family 2 protein [Saccharospirillum mangrovi]|uniref:glycosyltransferase family 2 protein n=1 Tax=Saccharospirillum mangrovi TaxID=2161747 RepID=UPI000D3B6B4B|nr:glycosyltransferase [Saccharospirillum mangrovi]
MTRLQHLQFNIDHLEKRVLFASDAMLSLIRGDRGLRLPAQTELNLNQLAHCFPNHHYHHYTPIRRIQLQVGQVTGAGRIQVYFVDGMSAKTLVLDWQVDEGKQLVSADIALRPEAGYFFVRLDSGQTAFDVCDMAWVTDQVAEPNHKLVIGITTFKREQYLLPNLEKLTHCAELGRLNLDIVVVDNGRTLSAEQLPSGVHLISQDNLGGTGGFMRSLRYAKGIEAHRVLFMDDDVEIYPELVYRALMFANLTTQPAAVGMMMMSASQPWLVWEQGAGLDYSRVTRIFRHNASLSAKKPSTLNRLNRVHQTAFTAWWGTALPVAETPFIPNMFIKNDDILVARQLAQKGIPSFTLPSAFLWHEDFHKKPYTWQFIYEMRNACYMRFLCPEETRALPMLKSIAEQFVKFMLMGDNYRSSMVLWGLQEVTRLNPQYFNDVERLKAIHQRAMAHYPMQDMSPWLSVDDEAHRQYRKFSKLKVLLSGFGYLPFLSRKTLSDGNPYPVPMNETRLVGAGHFRSLVFFDPSTLKGYRSERRLSQLIKQSSLFALYSLRFFWRFRQLKKLRLTVTDQYWDPYFNA